MKDDPPLMSMDIKIQKCILVGVNGGVAVKHL